MIPTGDEWIDGLQVSASSLAGQVLGAGSEQTVTAMMTIIARTASGDGLFISEILPEGGFRVITANSASVSIMRAPSRDALIAAAQEPGFTHPEDVPIAMAHVGANNSAPYSIRLRRVDRNAYLRVVVQGFTIQTPDDRVMRLTLWRREL